MPSKRREASSRRTQIISIYLYVGCCSILPIRCSLVCSVALEHQRLIIVPAAQENRYRWQDRQRCAMAVVRSPHVNMLLYRDFVCLNSNCSRLAKASGICFCSNNTQCKCNLTSLAAVRISISSSRHHPGLQIDMTRTPRLLFCCAIFSTFFCQHALAGVSNVTSPTRRHLLVSHTCLHPGPLLILWMFSLPTHCCT